MIAGTSKHVHSVQTKPKSKVDKADVGRDHHVGSKNENKSHSKNDKKLGSSHIGKKSTATSGGTRLGGHQSDDCKIVKLTNRHARTRTQETAEAKNSRRSKRHVVTRNKKKEHRTLKSDAATNNSKAKSKVPDTDTGHGSVEKKYNSQSPISHQELLLQGSAIGNTSHRVNTERSDRKANKSVENRAPVGRRERQAPIDHNPNLANKPHETREASPKVYVDQRNGKIVAGDRAVQLPRSTAPRTLDTRVVKQYPDHRYGDGVVAQSKGYSLAADSRGDIHHQDGIAESIHRLDAGKVVKMDNRYVEVPSMNYRSEASRQPDGRLVGMRHNRIGRSNDHMSVDSPNMDSRSIKSKIDVGRAMESRHMDGRYVVDSRHINGRTVERPVDRMNIDKRGIGYRSTGTTDSQRRKRHMDTIRVPPAENRAHHSNIAPKNVMVVKADKQYDGRLDGRSNDGIGIDYQSRSTRRSIDDKLLLAEAEANKPIIDSSNNNRVRKKDNQFDHVVYSSTTRKVSLTRPSIVNEVESTKYESGKEVLVRRTLNMAPSETTYPVQAPQRVKPTVLNKPKVPIPTVGGATQKERLNELRGIQMALGGDAVTKKLKRAKKSYIPRSDSPRSEYLGDWYNIESVDGAHDLFEKVLTAEGGRLSFRNGDIMYGEPALNSREVRNISNALGTLMYV